MFLFEKILKASIRFDSEWNTFSFSEKFLSWLNFFPFFLIEQNNELDFFPWLFDDARQSGSIVEATNHQSSFVITDAIETYSGLDAHYQIIE